MVLFNDVMDMFVGSSRGRHTHHVPNISLKTQDMVDEVVIK